MILVSVGRLVGWKGIRIVLDAIAELPKNLHLVVIGTGSEEQTLRDRAKVLGLDRRVHFAGHVDHAELPKWLVQCDLFVQPSIGEEAFGISVVEAMACGLPVLASNNGGLPEIVVNGETGLLLSPGDVPVWRDSILDLMKRKDRLNEMGTAGRLRAERHFSWAANAQKHEDMLQVAKCAAS